MVNCKPEGDCGNFDVLSVASADDLVQVANVLPTCGGYGTHRAGDDAGDALYEPVQIISGRRARLLPACENDVAGPDYYVAETVPDLENSGALCMMMPRTKIWRGGTQVVQVREYGCLAAPNRKTSSHRKGIER